MGYYMYVMLQVPIDQTSGQPSEFNVRGLTTLNLCNYVVPEEHRKYINNHGWIFHEYVPKSCREDLGKHVDAAYMAKYIPDWTTFKTRIPSDWVDEWTEDKHNGFKAAMEWFGMKGYYTVSWSF